MTDNRNICEEIEVALYTDTELSDEQKKHIESCQACRQLLSQIEEMKKDLGSLSVPGIKEGQITCAVMQKIKEERVQHKPLSFPKFKFVNHIGTIAAVAVIVIAAIIIPNTTNDQENPKVSSGLKSDHVSSFREDDSPKTFSAPFIADGIAEADGHESVTEEDTLRKTTDENTDKHEYKKATMLGENDDEIGMMLGLAPSPDSSYNDEDSAENNFVNSEYAPSGSGGGGGGSASVEQLFSDFVPALDASIFDGIEFAEDFEENVKYVNSIIQDNHFGDQYENYFDIEVLKENGYDNESFINALKEANPELLALYSGK